MANSAKLVMPYLAANQSTKFTKHNNALNIIDVVLGRQVINMTTTAQPALEASPAPTNGDAYIIAATATGDWTGEENNIGAWVDGAWILIDAIEGMMMYNLADDLVYQYDGSAWQAVVAGLDYESGTFTPVPTFATPPTVPFTVNGAYGVYTRYGRMVWVNFRIDFDTNDLAGAAGNFVMSGLPYARETDANLLHQLGSLSCANVTYNAADMQLVPFIYSGLSVVNITRVLSAASGGVVSATSGNLPALTSNIYIRCSMLYRKAA